MNRDLIIFVPGFGAAREQFLEKLTDGIRAFLFGKQSPCPFHDNTQNRGTGFRSLCINEKNRSQRQIEIYEVQWTDLVPKITDKPIVMRLWLMLVVIFYWARPKRLKRVFFSPEKPSPSRLKFLLAMMAYSLSLVLLFIFLFLVELSIIEVPNPIDGIGNKAFSRTIFVILTILPFGLVPAGIFDSSHASRWYLRRSDEADAQRIRTRLSDALTDLPRNDQFVTVLAHSAGVVVATEVLSEWEGKDLPSIRLITLGSPLSLWAAAEPRFDLARKQLLKNKAIARWIDFSTGRDWICTGSFPLGKCVDQKYDAPRMDIEGKIPFWDSLSLRSHDVYFSDPQVLESLLRTNLDPEAKSLT